MCSPSALDTVCLNAEDSDVRRGCRRRALCRLFNGDAPGSPRNLGRVMAAAKNMDIQP